MSKTFPQPFGKYILLQKIAMGGMAEIFRAKTIGAEGFEREVVIKRILPHFTEDEAFVNMFIDEATLAAKLNHANIVQIFDFDLIDDTYYIAMEYIEGKDLKKTVDSAAKAGRKPLTVPQCIRVIVEAAKGLHYAHTRKHKNKPLNLVHRDVSPHNIMLSYNGEVKLMDFGIAKAASRSTSTRAGTVKGKCAYMAPEQARGGDLDGRTDLFALAVVFWETLTGERLFAGDSDFATLSNVLKCDLSPPSVHNPAITPELDAIVMKALSKDPADRYADVGEWGNALQRLLYSTVTDSGEVNITDFMQELFEKDIQDLAELQESEETVHIQPQSTDSTATATSPDEDSEAKTMAIDAASSPLGFDSEAATMAIDTSSLKAQGGSEDATMMANVNETTAVAGGNGQLSKATGTFGTEERRVLPKQYGLGKIAGAIGALLLVGAGIFYFLFGIGGQTGNAPPDVPPKPTSTLTFQLIPQDADLYIDGTLAKEITFEGEPGKVIQVFAKKGDSQSKIRSVAVGKTPQIVALTVLEKKTAEPEPKEIGPVSIRIEAPADVNIRIGEKVLGKGTVNYESAIVGNEILVVAYRDHGELFEKTIQVVRAGQVVVVPGTQVPEGREPSILTLTFVPADVKVTVGDETFTPVDGVLKFTKNFVGESIQMVVARTGFNTSTKAFTLEKAVETAKVQLSKAGTAVLGYGKVSINANPWADVYFKGKKLGTTPISGVKVPAGRQAFLLKNATDKKRVTIQISKGKTTTKVFDMRN